MTGETRLETGGLKKTAVSADPNWLAFVLASRPTVSGLGPVIQGVQAPPDFTLVSEEVDAMVRTTLPELDVKNSETGCCPKFEPAEWDGETFRFDNWPFVRATTANFLHIPLNIGSVFKKTFERIQTAEAAPANTYLILSSDLSAWRGEHLFLVTKKVPDSEMVTLSGTFLAKVFEGPYREAKSWCDEMTKYVADQGKQLKTSYFFYTTCPKCARHYGKNYVVGLAHVES